jgi:hypothetical protein
VFDLQRAQINTAGAYVCIDGFYLFVIGNKLYNGHIPIVRIGGHREKNETGWQCAMREVFEETNVRLKPHFPPSTYLYDWDYLEADPARIHWQPESNQEPAPFLVVTYHREEQTTLSLMYFATTEGFPVPSSEVKGLLLLTETEIHCLCNGSMTLKEYLHGGGRAILKKEFDTSRVLEPFAQLRLLSRILKSQPEQNAA